MLDDTIKQITSDATRFFSQPNAFRSILILIASIIIAYWLSHFIAKIIIKVAQIVAVPYAK
jgi:hypothetical protein